jgi:hypothetical protein
MGLKVDYNCTPVNDGLESHGTGEAGGQALGQAGGWAARLVPVLS